MRSIQSSGSGASRDEDINCGDTETKVATAYLTLLENAWWASFATQFSLIAAQGQTKAALAGLQNFTLGIGCRVGLRDDCKVLGHQCPACQLLDLVDALAEVGPIP